MISFREPKCLTETLPVVYDFETTLDLRGYDYISIEFEQEVEEAGTLTITLLPLEIGRPEFYKEHKATVHLVGKGEKKVFVDVRQFDYKEMADAFLKYVAMIKVRRSFQGDKQKITIAEIAMGHFGGFHCQIKQAAKAFEAEESGSYELVITNEEACEGVVDVSLHRYGRESMECSIGEKGEKYFAVIKAKETITIPVIIKMHHNIPKGGTERYRLLCVWNYKHSKEVTLWAARTRAHPYLIHTTDGWEEVKKKITCYNWAGEQFLQQYLIPAKNWEVPECSETPTYVFPAYSQLELNKCVIAWKLTEEKALGEKAALYLKRLCDKEKGYMKKQQSYFGFIKSLQEYSRGDYKEKRACSAGWVQEAEFFIQIAVAYDLLYDSGYLSEEDKRELTTVLYEYMDFQSWLLTDGDGNNFQLAEATAGFMCAMVLQDEEYILRFLDGKGGIYELLSSILYDDGLYFEMASGYMKLAAELLLELCVAAENYGISVKHRKVAGCYDERVILAPWANYKEWKEEGMPFLGMSFERYQKNTNPARNIKMYLDALLKCLTPKGNLFSCNDGNEQNFSAIFDKAYYLYREQEYLSAVGAKERDLLYGKADYKGNQAVKAKTFIAAGAGHAMLRTGSGANWMQVVFKYGPHGGYHGHFDRLSLLSVIKGNKTFYNTEYAWFGYDSFLFKMWVQSSIAHNMVTVDLKMQEPSPCDPVMQKETDKYQAICVQTLTRWSDTPYGGQTPYLTQFPEEKCKAEGRFILRPDESREQGSIGGYTEPVFQRRMVVITEKYSIIIDYVLAKEVHDYHLLYHPMGSCSMDITNPIKHTSRLTTEPFSAGQFVTNCQWYDLKASVNLQFSYEQQENRAGIMEYMDKTGLHLAASKDCCVIVGRHPQSGDTFYEEEIADRKDIFSDNGKKTVALHSRGREAFYVSVLEVDEKQLSVRDIQLKGNKELEVMFFDGTMDCYQMENFCNNCEIPVISYIE